jgi:hypothetical protein
MTTMTIQNLSLLSGLQPEEVEEFVAAYDQTMDDLGIERSSALAETIAKEFFELIKQGVRRRKELTEAVMEELGSH